ncbi:MAG: retron St85 family effector protein [Terriglobales bacterium]
MLRTLKSTQSGKRLLGDIQNIFEKGRIYLRNDKTILFVCGGPIDSFKTEKKGQLSKFRRWSQLRSLLTPLKPTKQSQREKFLVWAAREIPDFVCLLAEDALNNNFVGENREFVNLSQFESVVAFVADGVLIFPESPGSHAEIGFFSNSPRISRKTLVANLIEFQTEASFLNRGPIHQISSGKDPTFLPPVHLTKINGEVDFAPIRDRLRSEFRDAREPQHLLYGKFGKLNFKERLCVTFEMIRLLEPVDLSTLRYVIGQCFKTTPPLDKDLRHLLRILMALNYVERVRAHQHFRIVPGTAMADFEKVDWETVVARVKEHYSEHFPLSSSIMSGRSA